MMSAKQGAIGSHCCSLWYEPVRELILPISGWTLLNNQTTELIYYNISNPRQYLVSHHDIDIMKDCVGSCMARKSHKLSSVDPLIATLSYTPIIPHSLNKVDGLNTILLHWISAFQVYTTSSYSD